MTKYIKLALLATVLLAAYELLCYWIFKSIDTDFEISEYPLDYEISKWR